MMSNTCPSGSDVKRSRGNEGPGGITGLLRRGNLGQLL